MRSSPPGSEKVCLRREKLTAATPTYLPRDEDKVLHYTCSPVLGGCHNSHTTTIPRVLYCCRSYHTYLARTRSSCVFLLDVYYNTTGSKRCTYEYVRSGYYFGDVSTSSKCVIQQETEKKVLVKLVKNSKLMLYR